MIESPRVMLVPGYLLLCLLLGGASAAGYLANMLLQLIAIAIIAWSLLVARRTPIPRPAYQLLAMAILIALLVALQLVPLPPGLWTVLLGREEARVGYELLGVPLPWLPISLAPDATLASALWLLPAVAILIAIVRGGAYTPELLAGTVIGVTLVAIALGAVQRAGNEAAYIYQITNFGMGTGFFANGNHMATLLMSAVPFLAALYLSARTKSRSAQQASGLLVMLVGTLGLLVVGIVINGSLAGLGLAVPVLCASILMLFSRKRRIPVWTVVPLVALTAVAVAVVFSSPLGNDLTSATAQKESISRHAFYVNTLRAIPQFLPFGSGVGSFTTIYPTYEDAATITTTYVNHAHSDLLELVLETGVPGVVLIAVFLLWWARRAIAIWRSEEADQFARAATIAGAAIIGHSLVDYPLRTAAISSIFAMCCALMAEPRPWVKQQKDKSGARHLSAD